MIIHIDHIHICIHIIMSSILGTFANIYSNRNMPDIVLAGVLLLQRHHNKIDKRMIQFITGSDRFISKIIADYDRNDDNNHMFST